MSANGRRHFLDLIDIPPQDLRGMIEASRAMKAGRERGPRPLEGRTLAMIFDKPSTRTRVSFDVAMRQLGGAAILLTGQEMQLGRGETIADTARVLSRSHARPRHAGRARASCHRAGHQWPDSPLASLPGAR
jgi:ornithine carbamoyltransferase